MKILVITQWFDPEPVEPSSDVIRAIQDLGHEIELVTGIPYWPRGKFYDGYRWRLWRSEIVNGIKVIRLPLYPSHDSSAFRRMCTLSSFALSLLTICFWVARKPDVIHVIQPPTAWFPAWLLSRVWGVPLTMEIQDMWPDNLAATGFVENGKIMIFIDRYCRWIYGRAKAIRVISPGFKRVLIERSVDAKKVQIISNAVDVEHYMPVELDAATKKMCSADGKFTVTYAGAMGNAQDLDTVIEAARLLQSNANIHFCLVGDGTQYSRLTELVKDYKLSNVAFPGRLPPEAMPAVLSAADVLLVHLRNTPLFHVTIPHKILSYLAMGKPILAAVNGDAARVVEDSGAGIACNPGDPNALAKAVEHLYSLSAEERAEMGRKGRQSAVDLYGKKVISERMAQFFESVVARSGYVEAI